VEGRMEDLIEKKSELRKKIMTLEWDKQRNQINFGKTQQLEECKKELEELESKNSEMKPEEEKDANPA